ncbi:MAG: retroviral-like aspartic protease family protein [Pseudomonadota bacterium]
MENRFDVNGRIEPLLDEGTSLNDIGFLQRNRPEPASLVLRVATFCAVGVYLALAVVLALANGRGTAEIVGAVIGATVLVMVPVWLAGWWSDDLKQRRRYQIAGWAAVVLLALQVAGFLSVRGAFQDWARGGAPASAQTLRDRALACQQKADYACADEVWTRYLELRPEDSRVRATLATVKNLRDDHAGAVREFERSFAEGNGGYDVFAYYARSLVRVGRPTEAITWYYRALEVVPNLVDVRRELSKVLVSQQRHYEALSVLQAIDARREEAGQVAYFAADRITIEDAIRAAQGSPSAPAAVLRIAATGGHYYAPVSVGWARPVPFMVDTGATFVSMSARMLKDSGAQYRTLDEQAQVGLADGRKIHVKVVLLERLQVGPQLLHNVRAVACQDCVPLLGMSALRHFDLQSVKANNVELLSLVPRT